MANLGSLAQERPLVANLGSLVRERPMVANWPKSAPWWPIWEDWPWSAAWCLIWAERFEEFGCLEWHTDREWSVDQMMHFLNRTRERNLEDENIKED